MAAVPPRPVVHCAEMKSGLERPDLCGPIAYFPTQSGRPRPKTRFPIADIEIAAAKTLSSRAQVKPVVEVIATA